MGKATLNQLPASPVRTKSAPEQLNAVIQALLENIVMRNSSGVETDGAGSIGELANGRPDWLHVRSGITINGHILGTEGGVTVNSGVLTGAAKASGYPKYLTPAGGTDNLVTIAATTTNLAVQINSQLLTLAGDIEVPGLALAPGSNNTCLVNQVTVGAGDLRCVGEFGRYITIDTVGSKISDLDGKVGFFLTENNEVFSALVDTRNNRLIPILRGLCGTVRWDYANNEAITLLKATHLFLWSDLVTVSMTTATPYWQALEPAEPSAEEWWHETGTGIWWKYSGTEWENVGAVYIGLAVCDDEGCKWAEPALFEKNWSSEYECRMIKTTGADVIIKAPLSVSVDGVRIVLKQDTTVTMSAATMDPPLHIESPRWRYLYVDTIGVFRFSSEPPRKPDRRGGWYHPRENWRCLATFYDSPHTSPPPYGFIPQAYYPREGELVLDKTKAKTIFDCNPAVSLVSDVYAFKEWSPIIDICELVVDLNNTVTLGASVGITEICPEADAILETVGPWCDPNLDRDNKFTFTKRIGVMRCCQLKLVYTNTSLWNEPVGGSDGIDPLYVGKGFIRF